jgi:hypothetical protein
MAMSVKKRRQPAQHRYAMATAGERRMNGSNPIRGWFLALLVWVMIGLSPATQAASYHVKGLVSGDIGTGLQLHLATSATCLADNATFTLHSTDTNDCFTPANYNMCCSKSIKKTTYDGVSTVICTCGVIVIGRPNLIDLADDTQTIVVAKNATSFVFPTAVPDTYAYAVTITGQPTAPIEKCTISFASGVISGADATAARVVCSDRIFLGTFN